MEEQSPNIEEPNFPERTRNKRRYIGFAVLCVVMSITLGLRMYSNYYRARLKNVTEEPAIQRRPTHVLPPSMKYITAKADAPKEPDMIEQRRTVSTTAKIDPFNVTRITPGMEIWGNRTKTLLIIKAIYLIGWARNVSRGPTLDIRTNLTPGKKICGNCTKASAINKEQAANGWGRNVSRNTTTYIDPLTDTTIIPGTEICGNHYETLVIIVTTSPSQFSARALIRETWASRVVKGVRIGFIVGSTTNRIVKIGLEKESEKHRDLIQENIIDSHNNLTLKSVALLKWYVRNCPKSSFLMKSDVNTFVDVELLVSSLANYPPNGTLTGYLCSECRVIRTGRYSVPKYMYPNETYPDMLFGYAYVMSRDVAQKLFAAALKTPMVFLEDVYITGLCAREAGVTPQQFEGISPFAWNVEEICTTTHSICHPIGPKDMQKLWKTRTIIKSFKAEPPIGNLSPKAVESTTLL